MPNVWHDNDGPCLRAASAAAEITNTPSLSLPLSLCCFLFCALDRVPSGKKKKKKQKNKTPNKYSVHSRGGQPARLAHKTQGALVSAKVYSISLPVDGSRRGWVPAVLAGNSRAASGPDLEGLGEKDSGRLKHESYM